jgi:hypothetical protein
MKAIGAGFGRTGTSSLQSALEELLGGKCYHMKDIVLLPAQLQMWHEFAVGEKSTMDWELLFKGYMAIVDCPVCIYYKEIMEVFPEAKIILTVRDSQSWWKSFNRLMSLVNKARLLSFFVPKFRKLSQFADKIIIENVFGGRMEKENCINIFERHNQAVREWVPKDRLLEYDVAQGWKPLCEFFGVEIPKKPFPHLNAGKRSLQKLFVQSLLKGFKLVTLI